ncbi:glycosyl hydrolase [Pseudovirgaria hyperparasitica]|uniref:Glycosyl hydrolase n=1 Tax=Pseudovirgaria hyperparasitica TaxID=470096 RepID=A0A6A6WH73_9PEZI|nr:glycosyl hydrolase [Pseudovirgaria hyperparasitica]KAF2761336.1 glycosyl hydrolase [Pseudovirgaria hyperparasitica]
MSQTPPTVRGPFSDSAAVSSASSIRPSLLSETHSFSDGGAYTGKHRFTSYKLKGEYERPWVSDKRMKKWKYSNYIIWVFIGIGFVLAAYINYTAAMKVENKPMCLIMEDNFERFNEDNWFHEVQVNGFGSGTFDWTTTDEKNTFVDSEGLHIVPTLTTDTAGITRDQIFDGYTLNLTQAGGDGSCTGSSNSECSIHSNGTLGQIIPPVRSARLSTRGKKSIRYGRIEVTAKFPQGDWLWPAIWMMPEDSVYGVWPRSGELDIAEGRGNGVDYALGGRDIYTSSMHWGPTTSTDAFWRATRGRQLRRTDFSKGFHTFGIEWSSDYLFTYVDSRLQQVMYWRFKNEQTMWERGDFGPATENSSIVSNPWAGAAGNAAPFDQNFYLILNVAVGGRNGWFRDGEGGKPWTDAGNSAYDFYKNIDQWLPTWGEGNARGMTVKSVKMWQEGAC